jgi:two-component system CheB/CheR fusion protein
MVMVQDPSSAKYDGMPVSAINTGLVDYILSPDKMAAQLLSFVQMDFRKKCTALSDPLTANTLLQKIFILLRNQTGHDFSLYKPNTIHRRIYRRLSINHIVKVEDYVKYLQRNTIELDILFKELLIGVTNFFRDKDTFGYLEQQIIPSLFDKAPAKEPVRIWVPGCSTGEEAYSIAILVNEYREKNKIERDVQIFATDIDYVSVGKARTAIFPISIAADVPQDKLSRYFVKSDNFYQINKRIRNMVIFAEQSIIKDPPFSKLDLISCRNLLIYLGSELQKKVIPLFHYALNPSGYLVLGPSESLGEFDEFFKTIDRKGKIFQRNMEMDLVPRFQSFTKTRNLPAFDDGQNMKRLSIRELTLKMLMENYTPHCVIINEKGDVVYFHRQAGKYLVPAEGEASLNIFNMARDDLKMPLTTAIRKSISQKKRVVYERQLIKLDGMDQLINLIIHPITQPASMIGSLMVIFDEIALPSKQKDIQFVNEGTGSDEKNNKITKLEQELVSIKEYLQTTIEELETSNEELKSTNEEMQSANEELQSTNEELETSKEELQSVNEDLMTVNSELQDKIEDLSQANNDISNLLANTNIATIFLDSNFNILRFTPAVSDIINLISSDIGRPLEHIVSNLDYGKLLEDAELVLRNLVLREVEVHSKNGKSFWMRVMPYRTLENVIGGVVITFVDITQQKKDQEAIKVRQSLLENTQEIAHVGSWKLDRETDVLHWSDEVYHIFGCTPQSFQNTYKSFLDYVHPDDRQQVVKAYDESIHQSKTYDLVHRIVRPDGKIRIVHEKLKHHQDEFGKVVHSIGIVHDITELQETKIKLEQTQKDWELTLDALPSLIALFDKKYAITCINKSLATELGTEASEVLGKPCYEILCGNEAPTKDCPHKKALATGKAQHCTMHLDAFDCVMAVSVTPMLDLEGKIKGSICIYQKSATRQTGDSRK